MMLNESDVITVMSEYSMQNVLGRLVDTSLDEPERNIVDDYIGGSVAKKNNFQPDIKRKK